MTISLARACVRRAGAAPALLVGIALVAAATAPAARAQEADTAQEVYRVGSRIEPFALEDQHGTTRYVDQDVRAIVFGEDMDAAALIRDAIGEDGAVLAAAGAVYVANVSGMPGIIRRMIAEPRMRRRPYPMLLDREGDHTARLPGAEGMASLIVLDGGRVARIDQHGTAEALRAALDALVPAPADEAGAEEAGADEEADAAQEADAVEQRDADDG